MVNSTVYNHYLIKDMFIRCCSMQMLTDWSRTRFLKVVFTSINISSHVELCETVYLFVIRICRILYVFDYRINSSNNIFTYVLSVDAIVVYLKDLQGRPKYAQFKFTYLFLKATIKYIFITISYKITSFEH
jgi:hypothetical protein